MTLTIKKKWFDMILSGEKKEEYREIKPYYKSRFFNLFDIVDQCGEELIKLFDENPEREILFRNGYHKRFSLIYRKVYAFNRRGKNGMGSV